MKYFRNQTGIGLTKLIIIIALIIVIGIIIISLNSKPGYEMDVKNKEALAYARLRQAIATSRVDGTGTLSSEDYNILGKMVKNADSSNQWFSQTGRVALYGNTGDREGYEVTWISDGTYCAIFYVKNEDNIYYLTNYSFDIDNVKGYTIFVGE